METKRNSMKKWVTGLLAFAMTTSVYMVPNSGNGNVAEAATVGQKWTYDYTGGQQTFVVPETGTYQLEVWGAKGGDGHTGFGGKGGYSKGTIDLTKGQTLYVVVGGEGKKYEGIASATGGYNGGGGVGTSGSSSTVHGTGGGATHIATWSGTLSLLINYKSNILIVGAGGGGSGYYSHLSGGEGGGLVGIEYRGEENYKYRSGGGGTQSEGGIAGENRDAYGAAQAGVFGLGGRSSNGTYVGGGGGGGGYYGGGGGTPGNSNSGGGGGGSSYIGGVKSGQTIAGNTSMPNPAGGTMTGNTGNGYAVITVVSAPPTFASASPATNNQTGSNAPLINWSFNAEGKTITKYEVKVGTTPGGSDVYNNANSLANYYNIPVKTGLTSNNTY